MTHKKGSRAWGCCYFILSVTALKICVCSDLCAVNRAPLYLYALCELCPSVIPRIKNTIPYAQTRINIWECVKWNWKWNDLDQKLITKHLAQIYLFRLSVRTTATGVQTGPTEPVNGRLIQIYSGTRDEQESGISIFVFVSIRGQSLLEDVLKNVIFS